VHKLFAVQACMGVFEHTILMGKLGLMFLVVNSLALTRNFRSREVLSAPCPVAQLAITKSKQSKKFCERMRRVGITCTYLRTYMCYRRI
jgi:hypothetical protein